MDERLFLNKLFGNKRLVTILLFSGSKHGWQNKDFHQRCDKKRPTITLFKVKDGDCIGGFTNAKWSSDNNIEYDKTSMLFNLTQQRHFPNKQTSYAIGCYDNKGPYFTGDGEEELAAGNGKCTSFAN